VASGHEKKIYREGAKDAKEVLFLGINNPKEF
jgi:hypothetical protein